MVADTAEHLAFKSIDRFMRTKMGRISLSLYALLAISPVIVHASPIPIESTTVSSLKTAIEMFSKRNPGKEISGVGELEHFLGEKIPEHPYTWLPLGQRYAFLKPGSGNCSANLPENLARCDTRIGKPCWMPSSFA
jgi:hypothetical protein